MTRDDIIARFYAAYNAHDAVVAASLYADNGSHTEAASGRTRSGRAALEAGLRGFLKMLAELSFDISRQVHAGEQTIVFYTMRGHMVRDIGPWRAHGGEIELKGAHRFVIRGGFIQETHDYWDEAEFLAQLGT